MSTTEFSDNNICVYGASSLRLSEEHATAAYNLGKAIAGKGYGCVNGGGRAGIMRAVSDGVLDAGGKAIGILPQFMIDKGWQYDRLSEIVSVPDMHARKSMMAARSKAAIAMPGGCGTLEELLEIITWRQLGLYKGKVIIFNINGYYNCLLKMFEHCSDEGLMKESHLQLWHVATTVDEVMRIIDEEETCVEIESKY